MNKIYISKNSDGDTRTARKGVSYEDFCRANEEHRRDVEEVMRAMAAEIENRGFTHDFTKMLHSRQFYNEYTDVVCGTTTESFTDLPWYQMHVRAERHHLNSHCPDDVNLIDVLEMVVDAVCAQKSREGRKALFSVNLPDDILQKAVENTVKLVNETTELKDPRDVKPPQVHRRDYF